jgi:hypothetical protein
MIKSEAAKARKRKYQRKFHKTAAGVAARKKYNATRKAQQWYLTQYGISLEQYDAMLLGQGGVCAICGEKEKDKFRKRMSVDHDHATGKVRGILCSHCNHGLGNFRDNILFLQNAITYLNRS